MTAPQGPRVRAVGIVKDEFPWIIEWIAHHLVLGVEHVVVYDNGSTDGTETVLASLERIGVVTRIPWQAGTVEAFRDAVLDGHGADWLLFLDADEFLVLHEDPDIRSFVSRFDESVGAIAVHWRIFGSQGHRQPTYDSVVERFTRAADLGHPRCRVIKSIVRTGRFRIMHAHRPKGPGGLIVNAAGQPVEATASTAEPSAHHVAQVNHYFCKAWPDYLLKQQRGIRLKADDDRGSGNYPSARFANNDLNDVVDESALAYRPAVAALIDEWERAGVIPRAAERERMLKRRLERIDWRPLGEG